jgi:hypothetical protein
MAAAAGQRMNLAPSRMAFPFNEPTPPAPLDGLTNLSAGCQRSLDLATPKRGRSGVIAFKNIINMNFIVNARPSRVAEKLG